MSESKKLCLVTIGATAEFEALIHAAIQRSFLDALKKAGYTHLRLQYGKKGKSILDEAFGLSDEDSRNLNGIYVDGFDFKPPSGLTWDMVEARGGRDSQHPEGVVISHAGSGTILEAFRVNVPLIVVPNPSLLHNHQAELAEQLSMQKYLIHGQLDDLASSIRELEDLRASRISWPPLDRKFNPGSKGLIAVMDEEMGFVD